MWVIGNRGMLGKQLSDRLVGQKIEYVGTDRELSILEPDALAEFATNNRPSWIINCAAYTAVDKAEAETDLAHALNVTGPANLARLATKIGAKLLHISTDYVFDGNGIPGKDGKLRAYREDDLANPQGVYGRTKADGETAVRQLAQNHLIIRTAWLYGQFGPNFVYSMLRLMRQRESLGIVGDQYGSPTWSFDLAAAIGEIIQKDQPVWGTFHYSGSGVISWYDFALEIYRLGRQLGILERDCQLSCLTSDQYPSKVRRPAWSVMDKSKIIDSYAISVPDWKDSLAAFMNIIAQSWQNNPLIVPEQEK